MVDLVSIVILTGIVLGVMLLVLAVIAAVVIVPLVRRRLADGSSASASEADVDRVVADTQAARDDGPEAA